MKSSLTIELPVTRSVDVHTELLPSSESVDTPMVVC